MSPSWRNRLYIAISPEQLSLLKLGRGLTARPQASHDEAIASDGKSWQAALEKLTQLLGAPEWQHAEVNIVLSNRLVRYASIPINAQLKNYPEQQAFARYTLTQTFGAIVEQWDLRIQHGKPGSPALVSAVDHALLEGLRQTCSAHKLKLNSITPYLMPVYNRFQKTIKNTPAWLVINEPGYTLFALLSGGELIAVNGVCHDHIGELPILLDRENLVASLPCKSVYLYASSGDKLSSTPAKGYEFTRLEIAAPEGFPPSAQGLHAMIMSGAL